MPSVEDKSVRNTNNGANLGFEEKLWRAADKLRGHLDAAEYKHLVLGLVFLKYISDAFEEHYEKLLRAAADPQSEYYIPDERKRVEVAEDRDEYTAVNIFWVPREARWSIVRSNARLPSIGKAVDAAMEAIERENPTLRGVLNKEYSRPTLDKHRLGELVDLISTIGLGDRQSRSKDVLGRVYEYFLGRFASAEGKSGGEFYTPQSVVRLLVEMIEPHKGRVYDPCCGSGGMFVQTETFVENHGGGDNDIAVYGQESNPTTWRLCRMNLAIRGIEANIGKEAADTFHSDLHPDLRADYILANPPFNVSDWGGERLRQDIRWRFGNPPPSNANTAWMQHIIFHLAPSGLAGFVLANGAMTTTTGGEDEIRRKLIESDLVDCIVALPGQLFYTTQIQASLWFLARNKSNGRFRSRQGETLFIDARKLGQLVDRRHRELSSEDIFLVSDTYHRWRSKAPDADYRDVAGLCKSATIEEIANKGYVLTPSRFVELRTVSETSKELEDTLGQLIVTLDQQVKESARLARSVRASLARLKYDDQ